MNYVLVHVDIPAGQFPCLQSDGRCWREVPTLLRPMTAKANVDFAFSPLKVKLFEHLIQFHIATCLLNNDITVVSPLSLLMYVLL